MITATLPKVKKGVPYNECISLTGTTPFTVLSHNVSNGTVKVVGNQLCISIESPTVGFDFAAEVKGGCEGCESETITAVIGLDQTTGACECVVAFLPAQTIPPLPASGQQYFASILLGGTGPFELCGGSAPRCLSIELKGVYVEVRGRYDGLGQVKFSFKNGCQCDCVDIVIGTV